MTDLFCDSGGAILVTNTTSARSLSPCTSLVSSKDVCGKLCTDSRAMSKELAVTEILFYGRQSAALSRAVIWESSFKFVEGRSLPIVSMLDLELSEKHR